LKHKGKALSVKVDIRYHIYEKKCEDNSAVKTHLDKLMKIQAQLEGMGAGLSDDDFITVVLGSLPKSYCPFISTILMSSKLAPALLEPNRIIDALVDKYEQLMIDDKKLKTSETMMTASRQKGKIAKGHRNPLRTQNAGIAEIQATLLLVAEGLRKRVR
jgi:hypothetical protein